MKFYDWYVKSKFENGKLEPVRICSHNVLSSATESFIRSLTYEEASNYCRNMLGATIMRGHPGKDEE